MNLDPIAARPSRWVGRPLLLVALLGFLGSDSVRGEGAVAVGSGDGPAVAKAGEKEIAAPDISQLDFSKIGEMSGEATFVQICAVCHGAKGEGNPLLKSPSIAGMPSYYLVSQFGKFRSGLRGAHPEDVPGMQMRAIATLLDDEAAKKVAAHVESMTKLPTVSTLGGDPKKGKIEYAERCMECHRFNGTGEIVFGSPPLVSLPDWYLLKQMQDFRDDRRGAAEGDVNGVKMRQAADGLDDAILKDIIAYIGELAAGRQPKGSIWR